jgi:hypothetical protein
VSVETSRPKARAFVEAFLNSPLLTCADYSLTSREARAIVDSSDLGELTRPMSEPFPDVIQDLWQLTHITASYAGRAAAGAVMLATGITDDNPIAIVVAVMFLPFLAEVLALGFGLWSRDRRLIIRGLRAVTVSTALAFAGGAPVAAIEGRPIRFTAFKNPLSSFAISAVIGITAGFPVWFGAASIIALAFLDVVQSRLISFLINLATIALAAVTAYAALHLRKSGGWAAPRSGRQ